MLETILTTLGVIAIIGLGLDSYLLRRARRMDQQQATNIRKFFEENILPDIQKHARTELRKEMSSMGPLSAQQKQEIADVLCDRPDCDSCTEARRTVLKDFQPEVH